jgi:hypothetical protein
MTTGEVREAVNFIPDSSSHSKDMQQRQEKRYSGVGQVKKWELISNSPHPNPHPSPPYACHISVALTSRAVSNLNASVQVWYTVAGHIWR